MQRRGDSQTDDTLLARREARRIQADHPDVFDKLPVEAYGCVVVAVS